MRLLALDDDAPTGRLIIRIANRAGIDALAVTNAAEFRCQVDRNPPDIIVLDLQLRGTDGVEQVRMLAEHDYAGSLLLISGFDARVLGTVASLARSLGLNVEGILPKPLRPIEMGQILERLVKMSTDLSPAGILAAIENEELSIELQPIVSRRPPALAKAEVLLRWHRPGIGSVKPRELIEVAETDVTCADALTYWVIGAAADAYQVLTELQMGIPLSVNISARNLHDLAFPDRIEALLHDRGMPTDHLFLELTESAAFQDPSRTMDILSRVRLKGMNLAIDDFGVGFSSLKLLRQMPFSEIKVDQSFSADIVTSRDSRIITKCIMDLAASMELNCVVEGVETREIADCLEQLGPCALQGFYIARPMPVEVLAVWCSSWLRPSPPLADEGQAGARESDTEPIVGTTERMSMMTDSLAQPPHNDITDRLSPRQLEVMRLLSDGMSVKQIARRLDIGIGTVKVHLSQAYSALGARNRVEAVTRAGLYR